MNWTNKSMMRFILIILTLFLLLGACSSKETSTSGTDSTSGKDNNEEMGEKEEELKPVDLIWYYPSTGVPTDLKLIEEAANKIIQAKINAKIILKPVEFGDYDQKMNTVVASGEKLDIVWTSNWLFNYVQNQTKGAFVPLDKLIDNYAPQLKSSMPEFVFDATRIGGEIYGIPNYQTVTNREGFILRKEFVEKYNLDLSSISKLEDIEPYLETIKENEKGFVPFTMERGGKFGNMKHYLGLEDIASIAYINLNDPHKVINVTESEEYKQYLETVKRWYANGWINQDAATLKTASDINKAGKTAVDWHNVLKPGGEAEATIQHGGNEMVYLPMTEVFAGTNTIITTMNAINFTSENPERAMMFLNLMNTDKELYNIICYGIEGQHYTIGESGSVTVIKDSGYTPNADWVFGNTFNALLLEGKDPEVVKQTQSENETATPSPIMGFKFDTDPVSSEIANLSAVGEEYEPGLNTGAIDWTEKLPEFQEKLKKAGADKVIAEAQKQLDEFLQTR